MKKLLPSLGLVFAALTMTGCELYFGEHDDDYDGGGSWTYCASDGYYICEGNDCRWAGAECPDGGGGGMSCNDDRDCAAGCYCENNVCEEAGFCAEDTDCPPGYHCDDRSSCVPNTCETDAGCNPGQVCNQGSCETTCVCMSDQDAQNAGYGWCDEVRNTCMTGSDPAGSCTAEVTCNTTAPRCPQGSVPLVKDGCYTGECRAIDACEAAPTCETLIHEQDCLDRQDCGAVYTGRNCRKPDGTACRAGDQGCVCEAFVFQSCEGDSPGARIYQ